MTRLGRPGPRPIRVGVVGDADPIEPTHQQGPVIAAQVADALGARPDDVDVIDVTMHGPPVPGRGYVELTITVKCPYVEM